MLLLVIAGAIGIALILTMTLPTIGPRWLFFFFMVIFVTGFFLPFTWLFKSAISLKPPADPQVIIRQAHGLASLRAFTLAADGTRAHAAPWIIWQQFYSWWNFDQALERSRWKPNPQSN